MLIAASSQEIDAILLEFARMSDGDRNNYRIHKVAIAAKNAIDNFNTVVNANHKINERKMALEKEVAELTEKLEKQTKRANFFAKDLRDLMERNGNLNNNLADEKRKIIVLEDGIKSRDVYIDLKDRAIYDLQKENDRLKEELKSMMLLKDTFKAKYENELSFSKKVIDRMKEAKRILEG